MFTRFQNIELTRRKGTHRELLVKSEREKLPDLSGLDEALDKLRAFSPSARIEEDEDAELEALMEEEKEDEGRSLHDSGLGDGKEV